MYGYIYITTNLINGKQYIGKHKSNIFDPSYKGSGKYIRKAFKKYGTKNFEVRLLEECDSKEELNLKEIYYITKLNAVEDKNFYNVAKGGDGGLITDLILINNGKINKYINPNDLNKYLDRGWVQGLKPGRINQPKSYQSKLNMSKIMTGKKHDGDWNINQKQSFKNKKYHWYTNGTKNILISEHNKIIPTGFKPGKTYKKEMGNKISTTKKGRIYITNGLQDLCIFKDQLDYYINQGYKKGRSFGRKPNNIK